MAVPFYKRTIGAGTKPASVGEVSQTRQLAKQPVKSPISPVYAPGARHTTTHGQGVAVPPSPSSSSDSPSDALSGNLPQTVTFGAGVASAGVSSLGTRDDHVHVLDQAGATTGQVIAWNGATWTPTTAAGDVTGLFTALNVGKLQGKAIPSATPGVAYFPAYDPHTGAYAFIRFQGPVIATVLADTNQSLTGQPTIHGQALTNNQVVFCNNQTTGSEGGLWQLPPTGSGPWVRISPFWNTGNVAVQGFQITVSSADNTYGGSTWQLSSPTLCTIDTDSPVFTRVTAAPGGAAGGDMTGTYPNPTFGTSGINKIIAYSVALGGL